MKIIYAIIGTVSLILGTVGIFFPILPTVPFLLLTSYCYAKASQRLHDYFVNTKIYKNHLESFAQSRSMTLKTKVTILATASTMLLFPLIMIDNLHMRIFIGLLYICKYYYFIFKIKTIPNV
ncbi:MAG: hypothetical protein ATN34_04405 [Epulopiscium sp. Nele67-Bin002]|nr:MAG: hypothetical protein ATN33_02850 [Epulopiscium sp. Nele67-Bin001]OON91144.1 MAG: hypothetical protein ATN34_04405 [Epulopiscium sp. Nele67-Bin002]